MYRRCLRQAVQTIHSAERIRAEIIPDQCVKEFFKNFVGANVRILHANDRLLSFRHKQLIRPSDSLLFREIMQTYTDEPFAKDYKQAPTEFCRQKLRLLVKPRLAVRYLTALDRRDLLWILVPEEALREVKRYAE